MQRGGTHPTLVPLVALLVESEVVLVHEDGHQFDGVLETDTHSLSVDNIREPSVVLELVTLCCGDAGRGLAVHLRYIS